MGVFKKSVEVLLVHKGGEIKVQTLQICYTVVFLQKLGFYDDTGRSSLNKQYNKRALSHTGHLEVDIMCCVMHLAWSEPNGRDTKGSSDAPRTENVTAHRNGWSRTDGWGCVAHPALQRKGRRGGYRRLCIDVTPGYS